MIRIDYKRDNRGHVQTTWVKEDGDRHSMMGRLLFTDDDFNDILDIFNMRDGIDYKFEEKKSADGQ